MRLLRATFSVSINDAHPQQKTITPKEKKRKEKKDDQHISNRTVGFDITNAVELMFSSALLQIH
jgi:hypothetical protein